ncbi:hypothetical protein [Inquilinus sp. CAU 1745]|uniref:hypothetical protein n=1 Tax=Inquilinus sp. CAU 1745 TaxID=3140369 RepID=UPI00325B377C
MTRQELVNFWQQLPDDECIHPDDEWVLDGDHHLMNDHVPTPWSGPILNAGIFLLYMNAGVGQDENGNVDPDWEQAQHVHEEALRENLNGVTENYMFIEDYRGHDGGANWLTSRLRGVFSDDAAIQEENIINHVAVLELVAYRSFRFTDGYVVNALASSRAVLNTVHDELLPRALDGEIFVACMRGAKKWGILPRVGNDAEPPTNIAIGSNQGGYATINTEVGQRIRNFAEEHNII